jgi:hypothetical protein
MEGEEGVHPFAAMAFAYSPSIGEKPSSLLFIAKTVA